MANVTEYKGNKINKAFITKTIQGEGKQRDRIQIAVVGSIQHALEHSLDFSLLSQLINGLLEAGARNMKALKKYITAHLDGVQWDTKESRYKRVGKAEVTFTVPEYNWWEQPEQKASNTMSEFNIKASLNLIIDKLTKVSTGEAKDKELSADDASALLRRLNNPDDEARAALVA